MPSAMISPTRRRGLREAKGSWKIICKPRRACRRGSPAKPTKDWPSKNTAPAVDRSNCRMARPTVVLPHPDSPTRARVHPGRISRSTPSTARTRPISRWNTPLRTGKCTARPRTSSKGAARRVGPGGQGGPRGAGAWTVWLAPPWYKWQRTVWPSTRCQGGATSRQWAMTAGQRAAKRHPRHGVPGAGTLPAKATRGWPAPSCLGKAANRAWA
jgi:hypothetical protein